MPTSILYTCRYKQPPLFLAVPAFLVLWSPIELKIPSIYETIMLLNPYSVCGYHITRKKGTSHSWVLNKCLNNQLRTEKWDSHYALFVAVLHLLHNIVNQQQCNFSPQIQVAS